jgi:hypothetical protein
MRSVKHRYFYLDTNAFRYFGHAFENVALAEDLRDKILISPLSAFEVFAQLADEHDGDSVLRQVHAIRNWTNTEHSGLLPWPDDWLYQVWFHEARPDDGFTKRMQDAFNMCLVADSVATFKGIATKHKDLMDNFKFGKAQEFKNMIDAAKQDKTKEFDITDVWFVSIANSVDADPKSKSVAEIVSALSAHHEFEQAKLKTALTIAEYNPLSKRNQNGIIDAEQLVYLTDPSLCMITSDGGFKSKVTKSTQATRIVTALPGDLMDAARAEAVLRAQ